MTVEKQVSQKMNLNVTLFDGDESLPKRVFVDLFAGDGTSLVTGIELTSVGNGFFTEDTQVMPPEPVVFGVFKVKEADGTTPSPVHSDAVERYEQPLLSVQDIQPKPLALTVGLRSGVGTRIRVGVRCE